MGVAIVARTSKKNLIAYNKRFMCQLHIAITTIPLALVLKIAHP